MNTFPLICVAIGALGNGGGEADRGAGLSGMRRGILAGERQLIYFHKGTDVVDLFGSMGRARRL